MGNLANGSGGPGEPPSPLLRLTWSNALDAPALAVDPPGLRRSNLSAPGSASLPSLEAPMAQTITPVRAVRRALIGPFLYRSRQCGRARSRTGPGLSPWPDRTWPNWLERLESPAATFFLFLGCRLAQLPGLPWRLRRSSRVGGRAASREARASCAGASLRKSGSGVPQTG